MKRKVLSSKFLAVFISIVTLDIFGIGYLALIL